MDNVHIQFRFYCVRRETIPQHSERLTHFIAAIWLLNS